MDESIIKIESLNFYWSKKSNFKIFVPSLEIKKGEKVLLLGDIVPDNGFKNPHIRDKRVVLPEPLSPNKRTFSPFLISRRGTNILKLLFFDQ